ncbi:MAG: YgeY family selenium metabolism-linked hydrolase [Acidobacteriota bacterium]|jgi:putative selenium metabolism hydrolase|nr:YgeY family selenium metabolism-linked hydrolase [Acidobacteriota bacterium]
MAQTGNEIDAARGYEEQIVRFLRDLIAIPAESGKEGDRCERVRREYESLGFDDVFIDGLGSVVARIGSGDFKILFDGHIDCVGVGDLGNWDFDPFAGKLEDGEIWGRGAVDELPAIAGMAYGAKMLADRGVPEGVSLYLTASVMEEDCDGYCMRHLIETEGIRPDVAVLGEPTDLGVYRGQRGRMEATITTRGVSAHGAHADRGVNALYKMAPIISDVEQLNKGLAEDEFLGKGSIIVSSIECTTPSLNAVPDSARIYIDRRLTVGETVESSMAELKGLPHLGDAEVELLKYDEVSWRGTRAQQDKYYPTWILDEDHPLVQGVAAAATEALGEAPKISRWSFSTNGVATMGLYGIPTVGFAPGLEELAHTTQERVSVDDLIKATAVYSLIPEMLIDRF